MSSENKDQVRQQLRIALRANASSSIQHVATGHLMRCLRLGAALKKAGHQVEYWFNDDKIVTELAGDQEKIFWVSRFEDLVPQDRSVDEMDIVVVDLPDEPATEANDESRLKDLTEAGPCCVKLGHTGYISRYYAAVISLYPSRSIWASNYFEGPHFLILDEKFSQIDLQERDHAEGKEMFVCLGGADLDDVTSRVVSSIGASNYVGHVTVVIGAANPNLSKIEQAVADSGVNATIRQNPDSIERLMAEADMAVVAFGTTAFELMGLGVPSVSLTHKSWQTPSAKVFGDIGATLFLGRADELQNEAITSSVNSLVNDNGLRSRVANAGSSLIDFRGTERVVQILENSVAGSESLDHLYVLAHPGDEVFGCGGTILKQRAAGETVGLVVLGDGFRGRNDRAGDGAKNPFRSDGREIHDALQASCDALGVNVLYYYKFPDNRFDEVPLLDLIQVVESVIERHQPRNLYTNSTKDLNIDHQATAQAVVTAARPGSCASVEKISVVEVPASSDWGRHLHGEGFDANWIEDISDQIERKMEVVGFYGNELRGIAHPVSQDSILKRAEQWGSCYGYQAAEVFQLVWCRNH